MLLRGGIPASRVLGVVARESPERAALGEAAALVAGGTGIPTALAAAGEGPEWRLLAAVWDLAERSGSSFAPALDRIAGALRSLAELQDRRAVLLAGPRATIRLVAALPPLAMLLGSQLGFNPLPVLLTAGGAALLVCGLVLLLAGMVWARALARRVEGGDRGAGFELELVWIALGGGAPPGAAVKRVVDSVDRFGVEWIRLADLGRGGRASVVLGTAAATGTPAGPLLLEEAASIRARTHADLEREAERLGIRVLLPLGVCVLPSFVLLGVVPVVLAMIGGVGW